MTGDQEKMNDESIQKQYPGDYEFKQAILHYCVKGDLLEVVGDYFSPEWFGDPLSTNQRQAPLVVLATIVHAEFKKSGKRLGAAGLRSIVARAEGPTGGDLSSLAGEELEQILAPKESSEEAVREDVRDWVTRQLYERTIFRCADIMTRPTWRTEQVDEVWEKIRRAAPTARLVTFTKAADYRAPALSWLVEGLLPQGMLCMLHGTDGVGKSLLAMEVMRAVLLGQPFLSGFLTSKGPVIALLLDDPSVLIAERLQMLGVNTHPDLILGLIETAGEERLDEAFRQITAKVLEVEAKLVIVDALYCLTPAAAGASNDSSAMKPIMESLNRLAERTGATVLLIHHDKKDATGYAGSFRIRAMSKVAFHLVAHEEEGDEVDTQPGELDLNMDKNKMLEKTHYRLRFLGVGQFELLGKAGEVDLLTRKRKILDCLQSGHKTLAELELETKIPRDTCVTVLTPLVKNGSVLTRVVTTRAGGRPRNEYYLVGTPEKVVTITPLRAKVKMAEFIKTKPPGSVPDWVTEQTPHTTEREAF